MSAEFKPNPDHLLRMSTISVALPTTRISRPPTLARPQTIIRKDRAGDGIALSSDPDWEDQFPSAKSQPPASPPVSRPKHPASKQDFMKLEECGHHLAKRLGWGALQGVALRESGQIAAQRYGYSEKTDGQLAEEAFSLLLAAI
jgi:hypothetical protein